MSQITGTGCMLGMICATYLAVTDPFHCSFHCSYRIWYQPAKELKKTALAPEASRRSCLISFTSYPYDKQIKKGAYFLAALFIYLIFSTA